MPSDFRRVAPGSIVAPLRGVRYLAFHACLHSCRDSVVMWFARPLLYRNTDADDRAGAIQVLVPAPSMFSLDQVVRLRGKALRLVPIPV